tara:strand:- start:574 stop:759 length:186 start_codon:yes stop_codon:yes gene_type:complete
MRSVIKSVDESPFRPISVTAMFRRKLAENQTMWGTKLPLIGFIKAIISETANYKEELECPL